MAINWLAAFKDIPWSTVLAVAPSIAEGGKKLWARVVKHEPEETAVTGAHPLQQPPTSPSEAIAALEVRVQSLETNAAQLKEETVSSFEVVRALTEQHSQLVSAVDVLIARTRVLLRACIALGVAVVALLILTLVR